MNGWMDRRVDERIDGWINGVPPACTVPPLDETEGRAGGPRLSLGRDAYQQDAQLCAMQTLPPGA